ncbi:MAG: glutamine synthetase [Anaerolineae bacterium]|nr:glutamine synthetase [Anaerolineae bacterium]
MASKENILELIDENQVKFVELWFTDITGIVKSITVPVGKVGQIIERGTHFDGSSLDGFARVAESDMVLMPDLNTFTLLPWSSSEERVARLICTVHTPQGDAFIGDPRTVLLKALKQAEQMGFTFKTGMELEFFLFNVDENGKPITTSPQDQASYFNMSTEQAQIIRRKMLSTLESLNIQVDSTHSEIGYGQHEIDLAYSDALTSADYVLTARIALKTIAQQHKLHCTFMPRPAAELPGSGMHTHQTLHDLQTGKNAFVDTGHEYGMSELARYFLAGQLCHARAMCAVLAPLVNSYKRLGTSFEAPAHITWAHINRAALIRVPGVLPGMEEHTRLELRCPDPASNPYLATAVMLMAGLDGIRNKLPLPEPLEETLLNQSRTRRRQVEMLPNTLGEALDALEQDDIILSALGPYISDRYLNARRQEYAEYEQQVTRWEVDRYINRY